MKVTSVADREGWPWDEVDPLQPTGPALADDEFHVEPVRLDDRTLGSLPNRRALEEILSSSIQQIAQNQLDAWTERIREMRSLIQVQAGEIESQQAWLDWRAQTIADLYHHRAEARIALVLNHRRRFGRSKCRCGGPCQLPPRRK